MNKKKNEKETIPNSAESEAEVSSEEEVEEDDASDATDDSYITGATQAFIKPSKKTKKKVSKPIDVATDEKNGNRKRKLNDSQTSDSKKSKTDNETDKNEKDKNEKDKNEKDGKNQSTASISSKEGDSKKKAVMFVDDNVDLNLYNEAPQNINVQKIKLSHSLLMLCQMIEGIEMKGNYNNDFAAITFQKKMRDGKAYEFSIPLTLAPLLQFGLQHVIDSNPQFFSGIKKFKM